MLVHATAEDTFTAHGRSVAALRKLLRAAKPNTITTIGYLKATTKWQRTDATKT